ncbi:hypothetical protein RRF57_001546 [Xylaria bambusicola]|uniref:Uncharacterized protein n=1 Tax=Xylaria bambusicola TaxID=326684 RepID=A0AAN7U526_9PEZI
MATNPTGVENVVGLNVHHDVVEPAVVSSNKPVHVGKESATVDAIPTHSAAESQVDTLEGSNEVVDLERYPPPTEEERKTLRKVWDTIPWTAWTLCLVEASERASYYGVKAVFNNFLQFPLPEGGDGTGASTCSQQSQWSRRGPGLGLQTASALGLLFTFLAYVIPILGAWWADTKVGRYPAIVYGVLIGGVAHVIMSINSNIGGAAPALLKAGKGVAPFLVSFFLLAFGAGIFKPNIAPTLLDQYQYQKEYTKVLKSVYKRMIRKKPQGSDLTRFAKITIAALKKSKGNIFSKNLWHNVKPSTLAEQGVVVSYSEKDVSDVDRTWEAVQIFLYIPVWVINDGGVGNTQSNQAAAMTSNGAPNDLLNNFNPLTIIVASPLLAQFVYPFLEKRGIKFKRIDRMIFGFLSLLPRASSVLSFSTAYMKLVLASTCDGVSPINIWWQIPNVALGALSEIFVNVTAYELAYARAPENMRATVVALFLFMTALSSALGEILIPAITDPTLVWAWAAPAIALHLLVEAPTRNEDAFMTKEEDFQSVTIKEEKPDHPEVDANKADEKKEGKMSANEELYC